MGPIKLIGKGEEDKDLGEGVMALIPHVSKTGRDVDLASFFGLGTAHTFGTYVEGRTPRSFFLHCRGDSRIDWSMRYVVFIMWWFLGRAGGAAGAKTAVYAGLTAGREIRGCFDRTAHVLALRLVGI